MSTVSAVLARKGTGVVPIASTETVLTAATLMNERSIGGLVVADGNRVIGIFTERDILRRVVAAKKDPATTTVREVMTHPVAVCRPDTTVDECRAVMTSKRIRHLPVVDESGLCGIVTIGDLLVQQAGEHAATIEYLESYIYGGR
jgi:CBS domain-containing protein